MRNPRRASTRRTAPTPQPPSPSFAMRNPRRASTRRTAPTPQPPSPSFAMSNPRRRRASTRRTRPSSSPQSDTASMDRLSEDNRSKLPQSLAGFFYSSTNDEIFPRSALHFVNASGSGAPFIDPSFAFLPECRRLDLLDCCNGLILCRWYDISTTEDHEFRYVVFNPATEKWVVLPDRKQTGIVGTARLGFEPAASPHFHVFVLLLGPRRFIGGVDVYSSETRSWTYKDKRSGESVGLADHLSPTVFLDGYLHLCTISAHHRPSVSAVDTKGEKWSSFDTPGDMYGGKKFFGFIQQSHGRLHYASFNNGDNYDEQQVHLQVYAFNVRAKKKWILKHTVDVTEVDLFGGIFEREFDWIAIHPESNLIFFREGSDNTLKCYSMDHQKVTVLRILGEGEKPYLPYVPLYSELECLRI